MSGTHIEYIYLGLGPMHDSTLIQMAGYCYYNSTNYNYNYINLYYCQISL